MTRQQRQLKKLLQQSSKQISQSLLRLKSASQNAGLVITKFVKAVKAPDAAPESE